MARSRNPATLDRIVSSATATFIESGYDRSKVHRIADGAGVGPGTVYLYVEDKEALFELVTLRALESPAVAHPDLPFLKSRPGAAQPTLDDCLHAIANFPQLWVGAQRREHEGSDAELLGILLELTRWLQRYKQAILLAERNRVDRPDLAARFDQIVWADLLRRLAAYLGGRMRSGALRPVGDPNLTARFLIDSLAASLVTGPVKGPAPDRARDEETLVRLAAAGLVGSGLDGPLPPHPGQHPAV